MLCHVFWSQVEYKIVCFISVPHTCTGAQFQNTEFFSRNNNASDEQFSLALQYVSSLAPSALTDKETREGGLCAPLPGS